MVILDEAEFGKIRMNFLRGELSEHQKWIVDAILSSLATGKLVPNMDKLSKPVIYDDSRRVGGYAG